MSDVNTGRPIFRTSPDTEQAAGQGLPILAHLAASYICRKSAEGVEIGSRNEDAICWRVDPGQSLFSFAACDGVSGSYLGYVASNLLADHLTEALESQLREGDEPADASAIQRWLVEYLDALRAPAQEVLDGQQMAAVTSPLLTHVISNRKREGSHAVFFCGCLDGRPGRQSVFAWLGNVTGQVFDGEGTPLLDTGSMKDDRNRWSSTHGCTGAPEVVILPAEAIRRICVFTDGWADYAPRICEIKSPQEEAALLEQLKAAPLQDDASLLTIWNYEPSSEVARDELSHEEKTNLTIDSADARESREDSAPSEQNGPAAGNTGEEALPIWESRTRSRLSRLLRSALRRPT